MKKTLLIAAAALLLVSATVADAASKKHTRVGRSMKNDTSRPLREVRPVPPRRGRIREMPKPLKPQPETTTTFVEDLAAQGDVSVGALSLSAPTVTFEGIPNVSGVLPPDTNADVGPAHVVQMVNSAFQIWDKQGNSLYGPADLSTIWADFGLPCEATNDGDPVVLYDSIADRWLLSQFVASASPSFGECVAISQTGDPTGAYHRYYFPLSTTVFYDYPHLGVWPDAYYMGANRFAPGYIGSSVVALERDQMLQGLPAAFREFEVVDNTDTMVPGTPYPADLDGPALPPAGAPNYIAQRRTGTNNSLNVYQFHIDWDTPGNSTFTGPQVLTVATYNLPSCGGQDPLTCVPQPNTNEPLDTLGDRLMHRFAYRNFGTHESMVINHTVGLSQQGGGPPHSWSGVRWYEVRRTGGVISLFQQGTYQQGGPSADYIWRWMGSIAMDGSGNMALGYSVSDDDTVFPGIRYTGRLAGDAAGTMQAESTMFNGGGSQEHDLSRWGDYSSMSIDPEDDCTFWYTNEYYPASPASDADWKTRVGAFDFGNDCTPAPHGTIEGTVRDAQDLTPISGALVSADNGQSTVTDAAGAYSLTVAPGNYDVDASAVARSCGSDPAAPKTVNVANGDTEIANFLLPGDPLLAATGNTINDAGGNNNGKINRDECFEMNVTLANAGCQRATVVSAVLSTSTPGVTITQPNSGYADLAISASGANLTPFGVLTSSSFVCGTEIDFTLTVSMAEGAAQVTNFSVPTCQGTQVINGQITGTDPSMNERLGRLQPGGSCGSPKACPGPFATSGTYFYDTYTFTNTGDPGCFTVTLDPLTCTGANQLHSSAYLGTFNEADLCQNFLSDNGFDPTNVTNYSFELGAGETVTVVVNQSGTNQSCAGYQLTMPAIDNSSGGGACGGGTPDMTPVALVIDDAGNEVLEAGESAAIAPEWRNDGTAEATALTGAASSFQSPVVTTHTLDDEDAAYGDVATSSQASCADVPNCYAGTITAPGSRPLHWDAEFLETLSTGETKTWNLHVGGSFPDAPLAHAFYRPIETLLHAGVTGGCGGGNYCPNDPLTRAQAAYLLLRAAEGPSYTPPACDPGGEMFPNDVLETDDYCPWIEEIATRQVMSACDGGGQSFCPGLPVSREQMAVYLLRTVDGVGVPPPVCTLGNEPYTDVVFDSPFCRWILEAKNRGLTSGCGGGNYCPSGAVDRDVMAKFIGVTFGLTLYAP